MEILRLKILRSSLAARNCNWSIRINQWDILIPPVTIITLPDKSGMSFSRLKFKDGILFTCVMNNSISEKLNNLRWGSFWRSCTESMKWWLYERVLFRCRLIKKVIAWGVRKIISDQLGDVSENKSANTTSTERHISGVYRSRRRNEKGLIELKSGE